MNKLIDVLEQKHSIKILIILSKADKMFFSELTKFLSVGGNTTILKRLDTLIEAGLIKDKKEKITSSGKKVGVKRHIWLTDKGKKFASVLKEIEKIT